MTDLAMTFPEIPLADIEDRAQQLLDDYEDHAGRRIRAPIPVESIAEHYLGYQIDITDEGLFEDPRYLGGIVFNENVIRVNASVESHEGRYNFTIAHEIGHHVLHRDHYLAERDAEQSGITKIRINKRPIQRVALLKVIRTLPLLITQPSLAVVKTRCKCSKAPKCQTNTR